MRSPPLRPLLLSTLLPLVFPAQAQTLAQVEFDPRFLSSRAEHGIDLSRFGHGNRLEPGVHAYDVSLNGHWLGREDIQVRATGPDTPPVICFTPQQVAQWQLNESALPDPAALREQLASATCITAETLIPDFTATPAISALTLHLSIPQAYLARHARGYVDPAHWQQGTTAGFVNYTLNAFHTRYRHDGHQRSVFGSINAGINLNAWRLRHNASYTDESQVGHRYRSLSTYAQRDLPTLRSQLTLGQAFTQNTVFTSVPYTGVQINSDDRMLPDSMTGFAPVIQGVADSNAKVAVFQNDNPIYETSVPPGPFTIDDLYNTGYAGDLDVVITEADGQIKRFTVPYASVAQLLRPGLSRYSVTAGRYRDSSMDFKPRFVQATYQRGLSNLVSAYGGAIGAEDYLSAQLGLAFNTRLGALAFDVTHADASGLAQSWLHDGGSTRGQSYRLSFSKRLSQTRTNITLAAYRFSSSGYLSLTDFVRARNPEQLLANEMAAGQSPDTPDYAVNIFPQRHRFQLSVSQQLGSYGSLYLSGSTQSYWSTQQKTNTTYQLGYSKGFRWGSLNLNVSRFTSRRSTSTTQTTLSLNIPLGSNSPTLSTSLSRSHHGDTTVTANVHGRMGERRQLSYAVYGTHQDRQGRRDHSAGGSLQYDGHHAQTRGSVSTSSRGTQQASLSLTGSVVGHAGGVNFVRNQGDTFAILHAPGAAGATVNGSNGGVINAAGYGIASNLIPYRNNQVSIDPSGSSLDVEIMGSIKTVAPTAGAIVLIEYDTRRGQALLLRARRDNGAFPPMGAEVRDGDQTIAQVGQAGRIFLRGQASPTALLVSWGPDATSQCTIHYTPPTDTNDELPFARQSVQCR